MADTLAGMAFHVTCPRDGHALRLEANGTAGRWETRAVLSCTHCRGRFVTVVQLMPCAEVGSLSAPAFVARCGTASGYRRHLRRGETACAACREAHALANRGQVRAKRTRSQPALITEVDV